MEYDFSGWATRNNIECSDGRTIMKDAFKDNHGQKVPLVWNHQHNGPDNVLGHVLLENREDGVYGYGKFNETEHGKYAKELVKACEEWAKSKNIKEFASDCEINNIDSYFEKNTDTSIIVPLQDNDPYYEWLCKGTINVHIH